MSRLCCFFLPSRHKSWPAEIFMWGGSRSGAGRRKKLPTEASGESPFAIAATQAAAKRARIEDDQEAMPFEGMAHEESWTCLWCEHEHRGDEFLLVACSLCDLGKGTRLSNPEGLDVNTFDNSVGSLDVGMRGSTTTAASREDDGAGDDGAAVPATTTSEAGVLSLASLFVRLVRQGMTGICKYVEDVLSNERRLLRAELAAQEARLRVVEAEVDAKVKEVRNDLELDRAKNSLRRDFSSHSDHICQTIDGTLFCSLCTKYAPEIRDGRVTQTPWIRGSAQYTSNPVKLDGPRNSVRNSVRSHFEDSRLHKRCVELRDDAKRQATLDEALSSMEILEHEAMANLMRTALHLAANKKAFLEYENLLYLQDMNGTVLGQREHSRKTAAEMIKVSQII